MSGDMTTPSEILYPSETLYPCGGIGFVNPDFIAPASAFAVIPFAVASWLNRRRKRF